MIYVVVISMITSPVLIKMRAFLESQLDRISKDKEGMEYFEGVYEKDVKLRLKNVDSKLFQNATEYYDDLS